MQNKQSKNLPSSFSSNRGSSFTGNRISNKSKSWKNIGNKSNKRSKPVLASFFSSQDKGLLNILSVHKLYIGALSESSPDYNLLTKDLISGPFLNLGLHLYSRLGCEQLRPNINSIADILNYSFTLVSSLITAKRIGDCVKVVDPSGSREIASAFCDDIGTNFSSPTIRVWKNTDDNYRRISREDFTISNNSWLCEWIPILDTCYLHPSCIENIIEVFGSYKRLVDVSVVTCFLDIRPTIFTRETTRQDVFNELQRLSDVLQLKLSENPPLSENLPLVELLRKFGCVNCRQYLENYLIDRNKAGTYINWVPDSNRVYACAYYNHFLNISRQRYRNDGGYYPGVIRDFYSLKYSNMVNWDPNKVREQFKVNVPFGIFATIDLFKFLAIKQKGCISYSYHNGVPETNIVQIVLPGLISEKEDFIGETLPSVIEITKWFSNHIMRSAVHSPHLQYTAKYHFKKIPGSNEEYFEYSPRSGDLELHADTKSILIHEAPYWRSILELEFFFKNHREVFASARNEINI